MRRTRCPTVASLPGCPLIVVGLVCDLELLGPALLAAPRPLVGLLGTRLIGLPRLAVGFFHHTHEATGLCLRASLIGLCTPVLPALHSPLIGRGLVRLLTLTCLIGGGSCWTTGQTHLHLTLPLMVVLTWLRSSVMNLSAHGLSFAAPLNSWKT